jgi:hypothetical protein
MQTYSTPIPQKGNRSIVLTIIIIILVVCCCCCILPTGVLGTLFYLGGGVRDWIVEFLKANQMDSILQMLKDSNLMPTPTSFIPLFLAVI